MEYYSDREKHGILSFVTTLMDLESIVVKWKEPGTLNTILYNSYVGYKNVDLKDQD
jgi:hypothetical protein